MGDDTFLDCIAMSIYFNSGMSSSFKEKVLNNASNCSSASTTTADSSKSRRAKLVFDDR